MSAVAGSHSNNRTIFDVISQALQSRPDGIGGLAQEFTTLVDRNDVSVEEVRERLLDVREGYEEKRAGREARLGSDVPEVISWSATIVDAIISGESSERLTALGRYIGVAAVDASLRRTDSEPLIQWVEKLKARVANLPYVLPGFRGTFNEVLEELPYNHFAGKHVSVRVWQREVPQPFNPRSLRDLGIVRGIKDISDGKVLCDWLSKFGLEEFPYIHVLLQKRATGIYSMGVVDDVLRHLSEIEYGLHSEYGAARTLELFGELLGTFTDENLLLDENVLFDENVLLGVADAALSAAENVRVHYAGCEYRNQNGKTLAEAATALENAIRGREWKLPFK